MYSFIRSIFFSLDAETAYGLGVRAIRDARPNPVGLAR